jgi:hypothetical protein
MTIRPTVLALLAVPALAVSACGSSSDSDQIKSLVNDVAKNPKSGCSHASKKLIKTQLGGSVAACEKSTVGAKPDKIKGSISVSVNGSNATATFTTGSGKRKAGFVKEGGSWKIDAITAG